jgi:hypothetical protein
VRQAGIGPYQAVLLKATRQARVLDEFRGHDSEFILDRLDGVDWRVQEAPCECESRCCSQW